MSFQRDRVRQNRVVTPNTDHRVALEGLTFNGDLVVQTNGGESVSYVATMPDGTIWDSGEAVYGLLDSTKTDLYGWYFFLHTPPMPTTIIIHWSVSIQAANQTWREQIDVVAGPLTNSIISVLCDGFV